MNSHKDGSIVRRNIQFNIKENTNQKQYKKYNNYPNNGLNNQKNLYDFNENKRKNARQLYVHKEHNNDIFKMSNFNNNNLNNNNRIDIKSINADYHKRLKREVGNAPQNKEFQRKNYKINNKPQSGSVQSQQKSHKQNISSVKRSKDFYNKNDNNYIGSNDIEENKKKQNTKEVYNSYYKYNRNIQQGIKETNKYAQKNEKQYYNYPKKSNEIINYNNNHRINAKNQNYNLIQNNQIKREQILNNNRNNNLNENNKKYTDFGNNLRRNYGINYNQDIQRKHRFFQSSEKSKEDRKENNLRNNLNMNNLKQEKNYNMRVQKFYGQEKFLNKNEENNNNQNNNRINTYKYNKNIQNKEYRNYKKDADELINKYKNKKIEQSSNDRQEYYNNLNHEFLKKQQKKELIAKPKKEDIPSNNEIRHRKNHNTLDEYEKEKKHIYRSQHILNDSGKIRNINKEKPINENLFEEKQGEQNDNLINEKNDVNQRRNRFHYQNYKNKIVDNNINNKQKEKLKNENNNENVLLNTRKALMENKKVIKNDLNNKHYNIINSDETKKLIESFLNQKNIQQKNNALINNYINDDKSNIIEKNKNRNNINKNTFISNNNNNINNFTNNNNKNNYNNRNNYINNNNNKNNFINNNISNNQIKNQLNNNFNNNNNLQRQNNFNIQNNNNLMKEKKEFTPLHQNQKMNLNIQNNNNVMNNKPLRDKFNDKIITNKNNQLNNNANFNNNNLNFNNQMNINQNNLNKNFNNNSNFSKNQFNNMKNIPQNNNIHLNDNNNLQYQQKNFVQFNNNMNMNNFNNQNQINNNFPNFNNNNRNFVKPINNNIMNNNAFPQKNNNFNNFNNNGMNFNSNPIMAQNNNINNFSPNNFNNNLNNQFIFNNNMMMNQFQTPASNQLNANFNQAQLNFNQMQRFNQSPNLNEKQINSPKLPIPQKPSIIKKPHANGLQNIGATCYMNATIQCLAHVKSFTENLLKNRNDIKKNKYKKKLSNSFLEVLENIWEKNSINYYAPYNFKDLISQMNPLFAGIQANDSKDLVLFLLETMHNELNKAKDIPPFDNNNNDQYNFDKSFLSFVNYFQNNFRSIVSDIFYGMYNSRMQCLNCNATTHNIQCYNLLIIPLEEVRKFKNRIQNYVSIRECFEYYQKPEYMMGQNQIYCNNCKLMANSINNSTLIVGPKVLIINLNRGKGLQFDIKLDFTEYLNIRDFIYFKETPTNYNLIGVVTHFGPSGDSGHFIAFCKSFVDNKWYKYNDAMVSPSSFKDARDTGVPYILFYSAE